MIYKYDFLLAFLIFFITAIFFYTFRVFNQRLKHEQHLFQQSRLVQMGEMISMIAHQWRQPLTAISATAITMKFSLELEKFDLDTQEGRKNLNLYFTEKITAIEELVQTLTNTISDFRNFYKPNKQVSHDSFENICEKSLNIIQASLSENNILIVKNYNTNQKINMYSNEMMQVLLNIFKNAEDNFIEKEIKNPKITITIQENKISICDNGGGIPKNIIDNIFDPYFSTKEEKNGTGIGLYMSKKIVEKQMHGSIEVENISHKFLNSDEVYEKCACINILMPLNEKDKKE